MALATVTIPGDGTTTRIVAAFALGVEPGQVSIRVTGEVDGAGNPVYRTFTVVGTDEYQVNGAPAPVGQFYVAHRSVERDSLIVDWEDSDPITEENLNTAQKQALMLAHEAIDLAEFSVKTSDNSDGPLITRGTDGQSLQWDEEGNIIPGPSSTEIGNAQEYANQARASRDAAATSASSALASANTATNRATAAANSATAAQNSATTASGAASTANSHANRAETARNTAVAAETVVVNARNETILARDAAALSASSALSSANNSAASAALAQKWAAHPENVVVSGGLYSALHYAAKAKKSAEDAALFDPASYYTKAETYSRAEIDAAIAAGGVPVGTTIMWNSTDVGAPGFLLEDGSAVSRTTYATLFAKIGTSFGAGDGSTTFNLPDSRGEFIRAFDNGRGVDAGRAWASLQASQNLSHTHPVSGSGSGSTNGAGAHTHNLERYTGTSGSGQLSLVASTGQPNPTTWQTLPNSRASSVGNHVHSFSVDFSGTAAADGGSEARPRNVVKVFLIRAF